MTAETDLSQAHHGLLNGGIAATEFNMLQSEALIEAMASQSQTQFPIKRHAHMREFVCLKREAKPLSPSPTVRPLLQSKEIEVASSFGERLRMAMAQAIAQSFLHFA